MHYNLFLLLVKEKTGFTLEQEYRFHPKRRYRADFALLSHKILIEIEGGVFTKQAHGSVSGILRDMEKYTLAAVHGWRVLRYTPGNIDQAIDDLLEIKRLEGKAGTHGNR